MYFVTKELCYLSTMRSAISFSLNYTNISFRETVMFIVNIDIFVRNRICAHPKKSSVDDEWSELNDFKLLSASILRYC